MRTPILAGNWKMHKTLDEAANLVQALKAELSTFDHSAVDVVVCPPFTALSRVADTIGDAAIGLGAQNMHWEEQGAFTGEVSPLMLESLCQYVILGHSERRQYFGETDEGVNRKIHAAFEHRLTPIVCVGENLEQNEAGETVPFVGGQVRGALQDVAPEQVAQLIFAYEPIWAIGTGVAATGEDANQIIREAIRDVVTEQYSADIAQKMRVQYGGSAKPDNIKEFMGQSQIDGALVGGASLQADAFAGIVRGSIRAKGL
jgi:triosephosphate isomerase